MYLCIYAFIIVLCSYVVMYIDMQLCRYGVMYVRNVVVM